MEYLVVMEVSQKQNYIFKTNRLMENIGASVIIREITEVIPERAAEEAVSQLGGTQKLILEGGGKSVYSFSTHALAYEFTKKMSRKVLTEYPGVELFMASSSYDETRESVVEAVNVLYRKLEVKKASRESTFRLYDLGITRQCEDTQLPAVKVNERGQYISAEAAAKLSAAKNRQRELFEQLLPETDEKRYRFANEFEELGGTREDKNYIAVVVIDGNRMGKKIECFRKEFVKRYPVKGKEANEAYEKEILKLSKEIDAAYKNAVGQMVEKLASNLENLLKRDILSRNEEKDGTVILPIRPLILAGDDICFVTDARIGMALAKEVLQNIENIRLEALSGIEMRASAGVAIVKERYPFFRAHELAEELCHSAKSILREEKDESVIDFHVVQGEIEGSLSEIRFEKYNRGKLTSKPYYLHTQEGPASSIPVFEKHMKIFKSGAVGISAIKEYRTALCKGEAAARKYLSDKRVQLRMQEKIKMTLPDSYISGRCIDFDVLEMLDLYEALEGEV